MAVKPYYSGPLVNVIMYSLNPFTADPVEALYFAVHCVQGKVATVYR